MTTSAIAASAPTFADRLNARMSQADSLLCIGLDPAIERLPAGVARTPEGVVEFCRRLIEATAEDAAIYKPNLGFFIGLGRSGLDVLWEVRQAIPRDIPVLLDCKVGDIDSTAIGYARGWFDEFDFDAITVNPFMGEDSLVPFLEYEGRGVFILCKTSNPGSGDLEDLTVKGHPLYLEIAHRVREWSARYPATLGLVVGATWPEQLADIRAVCPDEPILLPGVGTQGGDIERSVRFGTNSHGLGLLCSSSRSIMYASSAEDYAKAAAVAARGLRESVNASRRDRPRINP